MVLLYSSDIDQLTIYWFNYSSEVQLPQWHRYTTSLNGQSPSSPSSKTRFIRVHPANLEVVDSSGELGLGVQYARKGTRFYQMSMVGEDLSVRYCICTTSADATVKVTLPTIRVGWSKSVKRRRWKRQRKHFLRHFGNAFVMADDMSDTMMQRFPRATESQPRTMESIAMHLLLFRRPSLALSC